MAVKAPEKGKAKALKEPKLQNTGSAPKKPRAHHPYSEMINEAIMALKERTGSSLIAIAKFIQGKQNPNLPGNFKKLLLIQLKKLVANGKLVKVKNSFKLPPKTTSVPDAKALVKPKEKTEAPAKLRGTAVKRKAVTEAKPKKSLKTAAAKSPGKKAAKSAAIKSPRKKGSVSAKKKKMPMKEMKRPKSIKSPIKKATVKKRRSREIICAC